MTLDQLARRFTDTRDTAEKLNSSHAKNRAMVLDVYESKTATVSEIIDVLGISPSRFWQIIARARLDRVNA